MSERDEITVSEAAAIIGINESAVRQRLRRGTLAGRKHGRDWIVYRDSAENAVPGPGGAPTHETPREWGKNKDDSA